MARVTSLLYLVRRAWQKWLSRRSDKARIAWERFGERERRFPLPGARLKGVRLVT
jgi:RNA-directed DNA polymerase